MKTLYLECGMGAAGDMLTAALLDLLPDPEIFLNRINAALPEGVALSALRTEKQGIRGMQVHVTVDGAEEETHDVHSHTHDHEPHDHAHDHEPHHHTHDHGHHDHDHDHIHAHPHHHAALDDIAAMIHTMPLSEQVRKKSLTVYKKIAEAESHVHGKPVSEIHFHEVGTKDAVADVTAVCLLMEMLAPDRVIVSPVHVGSGHVHCAHGMLPVPAPATAYLLRDVPAYGGSVEGELCTPTGAALLTAFADSFGEMPVMRTGQIGYGFGKKDFSRLNCIRAFWGETADVPEQILELQCNLDDMTGEDIAFAAELLRQAGAAEVFTTPVTMKKNRSGVLLTVLCREDLRDSMLRLIFRHTATIGVREHLCTRHLLRRETEQVTTELGTIRIKTVQGYGVCRSKPEYDDLASIAKKHDLTLQEVRELLNGSE